MEGEEAAEDFVRSLLEMAPQKGSPDALVTVILDGENAWEWYAKDQDGKGFLHAFYRKLSVLAKSRQVVPVTMSEYINGNAARGVQPHPVAKLPSMEWLWPGSWINGNYDTWVGEPEENAAWEYLGIARKDLARSGVPRPDPRSGAPRLIRVRGIPGWRGKRCMRPRVPTGSGGMDPIRPRLRVIHRSTRDSWRI